MKTKKSEVKELVEKSGIITHFKVLEMLKNNGWKVLVSPYYYDSISDSVREVDLIAEYQFNSNQFGPSVQINTQLFIECKYIKPDVIFLFNKMDRNKAILNIEKETNLHILDSITRNRNSGDTTCDTFHYFNKDTVAKLFCDNSPNKKEDLIYKAMNQCLHSLINYRKTGKKPIFNNFREKTSYTHIIQYPVIICDNFQNISEVSFNDKIEANIKKIENNFLLESNYREDYFLIDVVNINYLKDFLYIIKDESSKIVNAHAMKI